MEQTLIEESKKRCEQSGRSPAGPMKTEHINEEKLALLLNQNGSLLKHAGPLLKELDQLAHEKQYAAVVVNPEGYILCKAGGIENKAVETLLEIGTNWSEQYMGTNAMGIVLREKQAVVLHGEHHYFEEYHILSCAASPIFGPDGSFYGAVNISTKKENYHPLLSILSKIAAEVIQNRIKLEETSEKNKSLLFLPEQKERELHSFEDIAGSCRKMESIKKLGKKAADSAFPVIIYGESGTGKELLAQSIHQAGERQEHPFIAVNCSAIPETLVESEFFGYEKGAFTGAKQRGHKGKFEAAEGGTIFLDEVGDLSMKAQGALLRVLQEKSVTRVGGVKSVPIDIRLLSATNKNLKKEIAEGRFREDLYYRLKGIFITMPPLREREDLLEVAEKILAEIEGDRKKLSEEAKEKLLNHQWPGNVRELQSALMQASFLNETSFIEAASIQFEEAFEQWEAGKQIRTLEEMEREEIIKALELLDGNITRTAAHLNVGRNTLYVKMKKFGLK